MHRPLSFLMLLLLAGSASALDGSKVEFGSSKTALAVVDVSALPDEALDEVKTFPGVASWTLYEDELVVIHDARRKPRGARNVALDPVLSEPLLAMRRGVDDPLARHGARIRVLHRLGAHTIFQTDGATLARLVEAEGNHFAMVDLRTSRILRMPLRRMKEAPPAPTSTVVVDGERVMADIRSLQDFRTRYTYGEGFRKSAEWALEAFRSLGLDAALEPYDDYGREQWNVVARQANAPAEGPLWLVVAHLDSTSNRPRELAPGADDNASGSAGVLEIARVFAARPEGARMRFVLFAGEEQGLRGSKAYVKALKASGETGRIAGVVNFDMIGFDKTPPLTALFETKSFCEDLIAPFVAAAEASGIEPSVSFHPWGSDHVPFLQEGIPCFLLIESEYDANPNYHKTTDLVDDVNPALVEAVVLSVARGLEGALTR